MAVVEYLPVATSGTANVVTQAEFAGAAWQSAGFVDGIALPEEANKIWRQSSMFSSAWAFFISGILNASVLDDGNQPALTTLISQAIAALITSMIAGLQTALGFTPVQQGTGIGQVGNTVKIGWTDTGVLKATVDSTDLGSFVFEAELDSVVATQATENTSLQNQINALTARSPVGTVMDFTGTIALNVTAQNTTGKLLFISGGVTTHPGGQIGAFSCAIGPAGPTTVVYPSEVTGTVDGASVGFAFMVPAGYFFAISGNGAVVGISRCVGIVMS